MAPHKVCVVGAGVSGLSTAVSIQRELSSNVLVTIVADRFSPDTTSDGSGGFWGPHLVNPEQAKDINKWGNETFDYIFDLFRSQHGAEVGAQLISGYCFGDEDSPFVDKCFGVRRLTEKESAIHPDNRFQANGGIIQKRKISSLDELTSHYDVVVNCTGLESYHLIGDHDLRPVRGQVFRVHAPWIKHFYIDIDPSNPDNEIYVLPGARDVVLGGTSQVGDWNTQVNGADRDSIWNGCCKLLPSLKNAKILDEWVGLRPQRTKIRVELERRQISKERMSVIVHNYGHGGSGVTLHWGCAQEATRLVTHALQHLVPKSSL
ncbi:D-amino-acid oxidase-like isoform X2 [Mizuhopecten yessoensis]|uniref:D-amino-acid oxidase n=1 Tax=Mizuhopecten yessoensis TaxID=6573 RepID=A0A210R3N7_MIZYE|nr:D-amino-acid oxidase-like isoform X2 [Mizuhopecten yessoensis]OWF55683.1 D-amino-acid oxidase [Mizuhopecten yessoensis]